MTVQTYREERRQDRLLQAQIQRDDKVAEARLRQAERKAAQDRKTAARVRRAASRRAAVAWIAGHAPDLILVPVILVPAVLAWTAVADAGNGWFGSALGWMLPALTEGAPWACAARVAIIRRQHPGISVWRWQAAIAGAAAFGAVVNFLHGWAGGIAEAVVMAMVSVAGIAYHQLVTIPPRASRADRGEARIERRIARKIRKARKAAVDAADVDLNAPGGARLVMPGEQAPEADTTPTLEAVIEAVMIAVVPAVSRAVAAAIPEPVSTPAIEAPAVPVPELTAGRGEADTDASTAPPEDEETAGHAGDQADTGLSPGTDADPAPEADTDPTPVAAEPDSAPAELPPLNAGTALPQMSVSETIAEEVAMSVAEAVAATITQAAVEPAPDTDSNPTPKPARARTGTKHATRRAAAPRTSVTELIEQQKPRLTNAQIAERAGLTERTIERRRAALKQKAENANVVDIADRRKALSQLRPHPPPRIAGSTRKQTRKGTIMNTEQDHAKLAAKYLQSAVSTGGGDTIDDYRLSPRPDGDPARLLLATAGTGQAILALTARMEALEAVQAPPARRRFAWRRRA